MGSRIRQFQRIRRISLSGRLTMSAVRGCPRDGNIEGDFQCQTSPKRMDGQQRFELTPNFPGESRHEFVAKLAYQNWERRGMPFGSPEVDWFAAERVLYESLVASGLVSPSASAQ